jgi:hypothetical protein
MATRHYIVAGVNCVFIEHVGEFVSGEGPANLAEILRDPAFRPGMNFFRDSASTSLPAEFGYAYFARTKERSIGAIEKQIGSVKMAWLVDGANDFTIIHQLSVSTRLTPAGLQRRPFRSIESAFNWLELPADFQIRYPRAAEPRQLVADLAAI